MLIELIRGQTVLVIGMARSGLAAARLLAEQGAAKIILNDHKREEELAGELGEAARIKGVEAVTGGNRPELVTPEVSLIIKSPGVPPNLEIFRRAAEMQIPDYLK